MDENKEQILADFMSCTGIDDFGECILQLESTNWNLLAAINNVMPEESQTLPSEREAELPMELTEVLNAPVRSADRCQPENRPSHGGGDPISLPSDDIVCLSDGPSHLPHRLLNFSVHYKEKLVPLEVPDSETVASIKTALHAELGVPPCRQELLGWRRNHITDETVLSSLHLPQLTDLFLHSEDPFNLATVAADSANFSDLPSVKYRLHIIDTTNNKEYDLQFPGSKTVLEVKLGLRDITSIPVRFQHWTGWPETLKDENMKLESLDIQNSVLELVLSKEENVPKGKKQFVVDLTSSESSDNEFEEAAECFGVDDDMFHASSSSKKIQPLIPEGVDSEATAVSSFEKEFASRYGACHPPFQSPLSEALQSSCFKSAKERRPLALYLHHDASVLTNVFCTQLLCSETVVSYLALNFVTWAWDLTYESNKTFLLALISQNLGIAAATTIKNLALDNLPALIIITKVRSTPEILTVIPGNVGLDDLMTRLIHSVEVFNSEITSEIREEEEREARELVKREQDAAYEASLLADRAKEEARRQEVKEKEKQEKEETEQKEMLQQMQQMEKAMNHAIRISLAEQLPPEPPADSSSPISHIRVRLPNGVTIARRFAADNPLSLLLTYLASEGYPKENYKVLASWPRRDLTTLEDFKTLEELKLYPKETLTLEER